MLQIEPLGPALERLPAVVRAIVERQTGRISPTAFEFIATSEQIVIVQRFMTRLPELLAG